MSIEIPNTISGILEFHAATAAEHHALNKRVDGLKGSRDLDLVARLKQERCHKKTAMQTAANRLAAFPAADLRHELTKLEGRRSLCSVGGRHATSVELRERLDADIALIQAAIPEAEAVRLIHSSGSIPTGAKPAPVSEHTRLAATG